MAHPTMSSAEFKLSVYWHFRKFESHLDFHYYRYDGFKYFESNDLLKFNLLWKI